MDKPDELDVLMAIDKLRRDLSGYHCQLKAYSDLKKHSERQRERIATLEEIHVRDKAENAKLRELVLDFINAPCTTCDAWADGFRCWNYDGADCGLVARARELGVEVDA